MKKIIWIHRFDKRIKGRGAFMFELANAYKEITGESIELLFIEKITPFNFHSQLSTIKKKCKGKNIIHTQYGSGTGYLASFVSGYKILTLRGTDWYRYYGFTIMQKMRGWLIYKLTRLSLPRYSRIIAVSNRMASEISHEFNNQKINVLTSGINLEIFKPYSLSLSLAKLNLEKKPDQKWVLFSSVVKNNAVKRFKLAEAAMELVKRENPNYELKFMYGLDPKEVVYFVNCCDLILITSTHEGWPNIVKEGLACNVPFVSTDVSDLKEIAETTKSCFICNDNPEEIAEKIVLSCQYKKSEKLRGKIEFLDVKKIASQLDMIYKDVLKK